MVKQKEVIDKNDRALFIPELKTSEVLDLIHDVPRREKEGYSLFDLQNELEERLPFIAIEDHMNDVYEDLLKMELEIREMAKKLYNHVHRGNMVYTAN